MSAFWRATLKWHNDAEGLFAENVLHFEDPSELMQPDAIGEQIDRNWWGDVKTNVYLTNYTSGNVLLQGITLQRLLPLPIQGGVPYVTLQTDGGQGVGVKHPGLGLLFRFRDGGAGRRHRGRYYHYGAVAGHLLNNGPAPAILGPNGVDGLIERWLNQFGPLPISGLNLCIFHRGQVGAAQFSRVTQIELAPICAFQRRRRVGIGT